MTRDCGEVDGVWVDHEGGRRERPGRYKVIRASFQGARRRIGFRRTRDSTV